MTRPTYGPKPIEICHRCHGAAVFCYELDPRHSEHGGHYTCSRCRHVWHLPKPEEDISKK